MGIKLKNYYKTTNNKSSINSGSSGSRNDEDCFTEDGSSSSYGGSNDGITSTKDGELKKNSIGVLEAIGLSVGGIGLSAALFYVFPNIANVVGTATPFTMLIGTLCCLSIASTISTFSKYISTSASFYGFVSESLGKELGFLTIWILIGGYLSILMSVLLQFCGSLSDTISKHSNFNFPWILCAVLVFTLVPALAYIGIDVVLKTSLITMVLETLIMLVLTMTIVIKGGDQGNYPLAFTPVGPYSGGISGIAKGLVYCVFVFVGFEGAATLGKETRNPKRNIPIAVYGAVGVSAIWLTWAMYALVVAQGASNIFTIGSIKSPVEKYAHRFVSFWFSIIVDIAGIISTFGVCSSWFNIIFRLLYSIGKTVKYWDTDERNPISKLSKTSNRFKTPYISIIVLSIFIAVMTFIIALAGSIGHRNNVYGLYTESSWEIYNYLSYIGTIPVIIIFIITNIAIIPYMKKQQPNDYKIFNHLIIPVISTIIFTLVLIGNFYPETPKHPYSYFLIALGAYLIIGIATTFYLHYYKKDYLNNMLYQMKN